MVLIVDSLDLFIVLIPSIRSKSQNLEVSYVYDPEKKVLIPSIRSKSQNFDVWGNIKEGWEVKS